MAKVKVNINGVTGEVEEGKTLLEAAKEVGAGISHLCFGNAICSTCRVKVVDGSDCLSEKEVKEEVSLNYHMSFAEDVRLACQCKLKASDAEDSKGLIKVEAPFPFNYLRPPHRKGAQVAEVKATWALSSKADTSAE